MTTTTKKPIGIALTDQVCTLAQANKLAELGVIQVNLPTEQNPNWKYPSLFSYHFTGFRGEFSLELSVTRIPHEKTVAAWTVAELGAMLPDFEMSNSAVNKWQYRPFKQFYSHDKKRQWKFDNHFTESGGHRVVTNCKTEAEARASMLIWLIEQGHVTAQEVNERLGITK